MDSIILERLAIGLVSASITGVVALIIATKINRYNEARKLKTDILRKLMGNRNDLHSQEFAEALNSIFVVFYNSKRVIDALSEFHAAVVSENRNTKIIEQSLIKLTKAICKDVGIDPTPLSDDFFLKPFQTKKYI